jgi:hypothetical protein
MMYEQLLLCYLFIYLIINSFKVKLIILHTIPAHYTNSLKGICATTLVKQYKDKLADIAPKLPSTLFEYVVQCADDIQTPILPPLSPLLPSPLFSLSPFCFHLFP